MPAAGTLSGVWGAGSPGNDLNTGVQGILDNRIAGVVSYSLTSSNVVMSATDCQNCLFHITGTLLSNIILTQAGGAFFNGAFWFENFTTGNFTVTLTTGAGSLVLPQNRAGPVYVDATNGPRFVAAPAAPGAADPVPKGTVCPFYQNAVPVGYTQISTLNDYGLRIVSSGGGVTTGATAYSTVFGQTSTGGYALLVGDLASHDHSFTHTDATISGPGGVPFIETIATTGGGTTVKTQATGSGNAHSHPITLTVQTAAFVLGTRN